LRRNQSLRIAHLKMLAKPSLRLVPQEDLREILAPPFPNQPRIRMVLRRIVERKSVTLRLHLNQPEMPQRKESLSRKLWKSEHYSTT
jgi:hypothetical protein